MKHKQKKSIWFCFSIGLMLFALGFSSSYAAKPKPLPKNNETGYIYGHGLLSCKEYRASVRSYKPDNTYNSNYAKAWVDGYLTSLDMIIGFGNQYRINLPELTGDERKDNLVYYNIREALWDDLNAYCKANLSNTVFNAAQAHSLKWYPENIIPITPSNQKEMLLPHVGTGNHTCKEYTQSLKKPGKYLEGSMPQVILVGSELDIDVYPPLFVDVSGAIETWVQGYVSGVSTSAHLFDFIPKNFDYSHSIKALKKYCTANPDKHIIEFTSQYASENYFNAPK